MKKEIFGAALSGLLLAGCCCNTCLDFKEVDTADYPVYAVKNNEKIVIDGKLDEKVWQQCLPANLINIPFFRGYGKALANVNKDKFQGAEIYWLTIKIIFMLPADWPMRILSSTIKTIRHKVTPPAILLSFFSSRKTNLITGKFMLHRRIPAAVSFI